MSGFPSLQSSAIFRHRPQLTPNLYNYDHSLLGRQVRGMKKDVDTYIT